MLIRYIAHSEFLLTDDHGFRLVTDPYDAHVGYPVQKIEADAVTVSHGHGDHSCVENIAGDPILLDRAGRASPGPDVIVEQIPCWHDEVHGAKRGPNLLSLIEMDGIRLLHCGDLGHLPDAELVRKAGRVDVILVPVGGFFTIDAAQAKAVCEAFGPRVIIPMHYRTAVNASWPIAPLDDFLRVMNAAEAEKQELALLRVEKGDLSEQPRLAVLRMQC